MTDHELDCLFNSWPGGTVGAAQDAAAIAAMNRIGEQIGYGWLAQLAQFIYEAQCHKDAARAIGMKRSRFASLGWQLPADFEEIAAKTVRRTPG